MSVRSIYKRLKKQIKEAGNASLSTYLDKCKFTMMDNTELVVEGYITVRVYTENEILFDLQELTVHIVGRGFTLSYIKPHVMQICGYITEISFTGE